MGYNSERLQFMSRQYLRGLDRAFWWVWMISLAPEETRERKSAFGRCVVMETTIRRGRWVYRGAG